MMHGHKAIKLKVYELGLLMSVVISRIQINKYFYVRELYNEFDIL
jgi:hypothetical protein